MNNDFTKEEKRMNLITQPSFEVNDRVQLINKHRPNYQFFKGTLLKVTEIKMVDKQQYLKTDFISKNWSRSKWFIKVSLGKRILKAIQFGYYRLVRFVNDNFTPWSIKQRLKFFFQRRINGFDDKATWSLDASIAQFVLPRLRRLRVLSNGYPGDLNRSTNWKTTMDKMVLALESVEDTKKVEDIILHWTRLRKLVKDNNYLFQFLPEDPEDRDEILRKVILGFEAIIRDDWEDTSEIEVNEGLDLFRKYFQSL